MEQGLCCKSTFKCLEILGLVQDGQISRCRRITRAFPVFVFMNIYVIHAVFWTIDTFVRYGDALTVINNSHLCYRMLMIGYLTNHVILKDGFVVKSLRILRNLNVDTGIKVVTGDYANLLGLSQSVMLLLGLVAIVLAIPFTIGYDDDHLLKYVQYACYNAQFLHKHRTLTLVIAFLDYFVYLSSICIIILYHGSASFVVDAIRRKIVAFADLVADGKCDVEKLSVLHTKLYETVTELDRVFRTLIFLSVTDFVLNFCLNFTVLITDTQNTELLHKVLLILQVVLPMISTWILLFSMSECGRATGEIVKAFLGREYQQGTATYSSQTKARFLRRKFGCDNVTFTIANVIPICLDALVSLLNALVSYLIFFVWITTLNPLEGNTLHSGN